MDNIVEVALNKVLAVILKNPYLLETFGYVDDETIEQIKENKQIEIPVLINAAANHAFDDHFKEFGISEMEGNRLRSYLQHESYKEMKELKKKFPFLN